MRTKKLTKQQILLARNEIDSQIAYWLNLSQFPKYFERWFLAARDESFKSEFHTAKVGAVIVYKNHIIGQGYNQLKTDPSQKYYNQKYRDWTSESECSNTCGHRLHAEIAALKSVPYAVSRQVIWKKANIFVYRVAPGLDGCSGLALPCSACANAIKDMGMVGAYYTTGNIDNPFGYCDL